MERTPQSTRELFHEVARKIGPRNEALDSALILDFEGIQVRFVHKDFPNPNEALIITPNHYLRNQFQRRSITWFSSTDSFIDSSIATVGAGRKKTVPIIKPLQEVDLKNPNVQKFPHAINVATNYLISRFPKVIEMLIQDAILARNAQEGFKMAYDAIELPQKLTRNAATNFLRQVDRVMKENGTLIAFAERDPSTSLCLPYEGYPMLLKRITGYDYKIWPVSIWAEGKTNYTAVFGHVIEPTTDPHMTTSMVMEEIARNLPQDLKGPYANWLD